MGRIKQQRPPFLELLKRVTEIKASKSSHGLSPWYFKRTAIDELNKVSRSTPSAL